MSSGGGAASAHGGGCRRSSASAADWKEWVDMIETMPLEDLKANLFHNDDAWGFNQAPHDAFAHGRTLLHLACQNLRQDVVAFILGHDKCTDEYVAQRATFNNRTALQSCLDAAVHDGVKVGEGEEKAEAALEIVENLSRRLQPEDTIFPVLLDGACAVLHLLKTAPRMPEGNRSRSALLQIASKLLPPDPAEELEEKGPTRVFQNSIADVSKEKREALYNACKRRGGLTRAERDLFPLIKLWNPNQKYVRAKLTHTHSQSQLTQAEQGALVQATVDLLEEENEAPPLVVMLSTDNDSDSGPANDDGGASSASEISDADTERADYYESEDLASPPPSRSPSPSLESPARAAGGKVAARSSPIRGKGPAEPYTPSNPSQSPVRRQRSKENNKAPAPKRTKSSSEAGPAVSEHVPFDPGNGRYKTTPPPSDCEPSGDDSSDDDWVMTGDLQNMWSETKKKSAKTNERKRGKRREKDKAPDSPEVSPSSSQMSNRSGGSSYGGGSQTSFGNLSGASSASGGHTPRAPRTTYQGSGDGDDDHVGSSINSQLGGGIPIESSCETAGSAGSADEDPEDSDTDIDGDDGSRIEGRDQSSGQMDPDDEYEESDIHINAFRPLGSPDDDDDSDDSDYQKDPRSQRPQREVTPQLP